MVAGRREMAGPEFGSAAFCWTGLSGRGLAQSWMAVSGSLIYVPEKAPEWSLFLHEGSDDLAQMKIRMCVLESKDELKMIYRSWYVLLTSCCVTNYSKILCIQQTFMVARWLWVREAGLTD